MDNAKILKQLEKIFKDVLDDKSITLTEATTASDVESWDSLAHIELVTAMEKQFKVKFRAQEIISWKNVGDILNAINSKVS